MATKKPETVEVVEVVEAFVLCDCGFGKAGEVLTLARLDAETGALNGVLDLHPDAIEAHKA